MKSPGLHPSCRIPLFLLLGLALVSPDLTLATTKLRPVGGGGGQTFLAECPQGSYLVGLHGRAGEWVDTIAPVCAPWLPPQQAFGAPLVGPSFGGSTGGVVRESACNGGTITNRAIQQWTVSLLKSDNRFVQNLNMSCVSLAPPLNPVVSLYFGGILLQQEKRPLVGGGRFGVAPIPQICPPGEVAVGIHGRAGLFLDAVGLICGPLPPKPETSATRMNPNAKKPSPVQQTSPLPSSSVTQPSPVQQTAPLPSSSVMQSPSQGSSAATGMIRMRGVDEKEAPQETPVPEKKP